MAIRFPESCRNVTAGAMRQVKQTGATTASGGLFSTDYVRQLSTTDLRTFLSKREPVGIFMTALEQASQDIAKTTEAIQASTRKMVQDADDATKTLNEVGRKMRDNTDKLGAAMAKFSGIFKGADFAAQAAAAASLADSLERLAALQERGLLDKVMQALKKDA